jgi:hypothetical protein
MTIEVILRAHIARYPAMQIQDVYKLLQQAALGSEHAISSAVGARQWLLQELAEMGTRPEEAMIDPISADGQIVRVHLRPFVAQGRDPETLLNAFLRTAQEFRGDPKILNNYWHAAQSTQHFPQTAMHAFIESMQARAYPAVHHTPEYERLYRPAYRVVWRKFIR